MNLLSMTLGLPIEAYDPDGVKGYRVVRFDGVTLYDYDTRQEYHFHGNDWLLRRKLFVDQHSGLSPQVIGAVQDVVRISKEDWPRTKGGKLKKVGA